MTASLDLPTPRSAQDYGDGLHYVLHGMGDYRDGKTVDAVVLLDPITNDLLIPGALTLTSLSMADGADVVEGSTTDNVGDPTVIGQLKQVVADLSATLTITPRKGTTSFGHETVGTTPVLLLAANPARISATIQNMTGGSDLVLGHDANVVASSPGPGQYLGLVVASGGEAEDTDSDGDWYAVCAAGSADVRICEVA